VTDALRALIAMLAQQIVDEFDQVREQGKDQQPETEEAER